MHIEWHIVELVDQIKNNWGEYLIIGVDASGRSYEGLTQTYINAPKIEDVYDIIKTKNN